MAYINKQSGEVIETINEENKAVALTLPANLADVVPVDFGTDERAGAVAYIAHLAASNIKVVTNGDWATTGELPDGYAINVIPIGKRKEVEGETKRVTQFVVAAAVPTLEAVIQAAGGEAYVRDSLNSAFATKIRNAFAKDNDTANVTLPFSITQFIERAERSDAGLATFKEVGKLLVEFLKGKGVSINLNMLKQCLQSASFAQAVLPGVAQTVWVKLLDAGAAKATEKQLSPAIFEHWKATRDTAKNETTLDDINI